MKTLYQEVMDFLQEKSNPDKLDFYFFGVLPEEEGVQLYNVGEEPMDFDYRGIYVVNNSGTHYDETIVIGEDGKIVHLPEKHPTDPLGQAYDPLYGISVYDNLDAFKEDLA